MPADRLRRSRSPCVPCGMPADRLRRSRSPCVPCGMPADRLRRSRSPCVPSSGTNDQVQPTAAASGGRVASTVGQRRRSGPWFGAGRGSARGARQPTRASLDPVRPSGRHRHRASLDPVGSAQSAGSRSDTARSLDPVGSAQSAGRSDTAPHSTRWGRPSRPADPTPRLTRPGGVGPVGRQVRHRASLDPVGSAQSAGRSDTAPHSTRWGRPSRPADPTPPNPHTNKTPGLVDQGSRSVHGCGARRRCGDRKR